MAQPESRADRPRQTAPLPHPLPSNADGGPRGPGAAGGAGPAAGGGRLRGAGGGGSGVPHQAHRPAAPANWTHHAEGRGRAAATDWRRGTALNLSPDSLGKNFAAFALGLRLESDLTDEILDSLSQFFDLVISRNNKDSDWQALHSHIPFLCKYLRLDLDLLL